MERWSGQQSAIMPRLSRGHRGWSDRQSAPSRSRDQGPSSGERAPTETAGLLRPRKRRSAAVRRTLSWRRSFVGGGPLPSPGPQPVRRRVGTVADGSETGGTGGQSPPGPRRRPAELGQIHATRAEGGKRPQRCPRGSGRSLMRSEGGPRPFGPSLGRSPSKGRARLSRPS